MRVLGQGGARIDMSLRGHQLESSRRALGYYLIQTHCYFRPLYHSATTQVLS